MWAGAIVVFGVLGFMAYLNATSPAYGCTIVFDPTPAPATSGSPAPAGSPPPGSPGPDGSAAPSPVPSVTAYIQPDMGHEHVSPGSFVKYLYCPPASGKHYNATGLGPIRADVYGPEEQTRPQGWIHNLEHGAVVILYRCPGPGCEESAIAAYEALYQVWPASRVCKFPPRQLSPAITRFDDMPWPYAVLAWDVVMPLETFDQQAILDFQATYEERFNPEKLCTPPTPTPGPSGTPAPSGSPGTSPTASPAASTPASSAPVESPAAPAASPS